MVTYINRYKDKITFEKEGSFVIMRGYLLDFLQVTTNDNDKIVGIDPSGGPWIRKGEDLGGFGKELKGNIVKNITIEEDCIKLEVVNE